MFSGFIKRICDADKRENETWYRTLARECSVESIQTLYEQQIAPYEAKLEATE